MLGCKMLGDDNSHDKATLQSGRVNKVQFSFMIMIMIKNTYIVHFFVFITEMSQIDVVSFKKVTSNVFLQNRICYA